MRQDAVLAEFIKAFPESEISVNTAKNNLRALKESQFESVAEHSACRISTHIPHTESIGIKGTQLLLPTANSAATEEEIVRVNYISQSKAKIERKDLYGQCRRKGLKNCYARFFEWNKEQVASEGKDRGFFCSRKAMKEEKIRRRGEVVEDSVSESVKSIIYDVNY
eukprot:TRINITY_DN5924_c0_g2_i2.p1 TRINITY_DN5924_c0_g2~~TRINITY_DN5924_c0_g2_i2.p1  ORF type:complete len:166 (+),score=25.73 TRINITY_DN5924_c0_g2_i2:205-702(+)